MNKKFFLVLIVLFTLTSFSLFARTNSSLSLGINGSYDNRNNINYGINLDIKHYFLGFNFDFESNHKVDRINTDALFGFTLLYNNYVGKNFHSLSFSTLFGMGFNFSVPKVNKYYAITPMCRLAFSWTSPINLELRLFGDFGFDFELSSKKTRTFVYKAGLVIAYSFDLEEEDFAHKNLKYKD